MGNGGDTVLWNYSGVQDVGGAVVDIAELRTTAGLARSDLARALGTTAHSVARWEAGTVAPRTHFEERLLELQALVALLRGLLAPQPALGYAKPLDGLVAGRFGDIIAAAEAEARERATVGSSPTGAL
ncbi:MAG: helix-turn-helix domain-containing protein [Egibacteraceae bacterium]